MVIMLITSHSLFAQVENPYAGFNPKELKNNKEYAKNFNAGNYSTKVLYNCMIEMINLARKEYTFAEPMKHDVKLDSTAQMQANYQASKEERTEFNAAPYKTLPFRLTKYGLSKQGMELVTRAKAHKGNDEYTYYDLCFELINSILKNVKTAATLLDKQYSYIGFGYETDQYMRNMYVSYILGNDKIFLPYKPLPAEKDLPYTKKSNMELFDSRVCQKCSEDISLEQLSSFISVKYDEITIACDDIKLLRKMIGREGDAIVLDFIQQSQYGCDKNRVDNNRPYRGYVTKPITFAALVAANEVTDKKSGKLIAKAGKTPDELDPDAEYDINIIVLKEGKYACRTVIKKSVECKSANYEEKINFCKDETTIKSAGDWAVSPEETTVEFTIPLSLTKMEYTYADVAAKIDSLNLPKYTLRKVEVIAQNSVNHSKDAVQIANQKKRAESIVKIFKTRNPAAATDISLSDGWGDFQRDLVYSEDYYDLVLLTKDEAIQKMKNNKGAIEKAIEAEYLVNHRYARIVLHVTYDVQGKDEPAYAVYKFNKAIEQKNLPLAMSIQKYIMQQVEKKNYTSDVTTNMSIPENAQHQPFLLNKLYIQYLLVPKMTDKIAFDLKKVYEMNTANQVANFNKSVIDVYNTSLTSVSDITKMQTALDRLYTMNTLPKERINSLNMELQFKIITYLTSIPATIETDAALTNTYTKIKAIKNPKMDSWQNAYKLASYFIKNYDYVYAMELMSPFLNDATISDDFLFSYISLGAHRPETYLSSHFTNSVKMGAEKNLQRLCGLFDRLPACLFDNEEVKKVVCKACER